MPSSFKSLTINDTGYFQIPNGTTSTRPTLTSTVQSFPSVGTTSWTCPANVTSVEVLVVAGGGGGGGHAANDKGGAGGGAGGLIYNSAYPVTPGTSYTVTVGAGGTAGTAGGGNGGTGGNSVFDKLVAFGGGGGYGGTGGGPYNGLSGGSGGGAVSAGTVGGIGGAGVAGQGFKGGDGTPATNNSAGGGGAGSAGNDITSINGGSGGSGLQFNISGTPTWFAGGGGGAAYSGTAGFGGQGGGGAGAQNANGVAGIDGTGGGGGGGGGGGSSTTYAGGAGGSGIVILRYSLTADSTTPAGYTRFNTSGNSLESYRKGKWSASDGLLLNLDAANYVSGNNLTDTVTGITATWVAGITYSAANGGTLVFDGTTPGSIIDLKINAHALGVRNNITIMGYMKSSAAANGYLLSDWNNKGFALRQDSTGSMTFYYYGNGVNQNGEEMVRIAPGYYTPGYAANTWYHMAAVVNNRIAYLYLNSVLVGVRELYGASREVGISISSLKIGNRGDTDSIIGIGLGMTFGNVLMYGRGLSATEVSAHYNATKSRFGL